MACLCGIDNLLCVGLRERECLPRDPALGSLFVYICSICIQVRLYNANSVFAGMDFAKLKQMCILNKYPHADSIQIKVQIPILNFQIKITLFTFTCGWPLYCVLRCISWYLMLINFAYNSQIWMRGLAHLRQLSQRFLRWRQSCELINRHGGEPWASIYEMIIWAQQHFKWMLPVNCAVRLGDLLHVRASAIVQLVRTLFQYKSKGNPVNRPQKLDSMCNDGYIVDCTISITASIFLVFWNMHAIAE